MITITRVFEWDAGHRVLNHEGKCAHLHGHRYKAQVEVSGELDSIGRVIDFSIIKTIVGKWIDDNWDHNMMLHEADPLMNLYIPSLQDAKILNENDNGLIFQEPDAPERIVSYSNDLFAGKAPYSFGKDNPTAENIAYVLFYVVEELLSPYEIQTNSVIVWETPNCFACFKKPLAPPIQHQNQIPLN